ncbi:MAG: hypothetical protein CMJ18_09410 [Phycisphaeraceae bacterium]|nr:hypothetical protein [Phycisphaeraceae bacterium]
MRVIVPLVLSILLCSGDGASASRMRLQEFSTRRYNIHSDLSLTEVRQFGRHMDAVFDEFARRFKAFAPRHEKSMPLYLFADRETYVQFMGDAGVDASNTGGMFFVQPKLRGLATWVRGRPQSQSFAVLQHEGFHQFAHQYIGPTLPIWANEGLAQYFEDGIFLRGRLLLGHRHDRRVTGVRQAIQDQRTIPFTDMLAMTDRAWSRQVTSTEGGAAVMYDQAWSMVYYLIRTSKKRAKAFARYLEVLSDGKQGLDAFREVFGDNVRAFERGWTKFAMSTQPDMLNTAVVRMEFLGQGLKLLRERDYRMPRTLEQLQKVLRDSKFWVDVYGHNNVTRFSAQDSVNFGFSLPGGRFQQFRLIKSPEPDLPPRITAQGLNPVPTVVWSRDGEGKLVQQIAYR